MTACLLCNPFLLAAAAAAVCLPQGKLRVTIQGETIEQQFSEREVCFR
jgi:phosphoenolpyruvate carboxylase